MHNEKIKKVLIITNLLYAAPRISGIAKYLTEFGWEPIILTPPVDSDSRNALRCSSNLGEQIKIIKTNGYRDSLWILKKILSLFKSHNSKLAQQKKCSRRTKAIISAALRTYQTFFSYPDKDRNWLKTALKVGDEIIKKEKISILLSSSAPYTSHLIACKLKKQFGLPWVADLRDLWAQNANYPYPWWRRVFEKKLEVKTLSSANALITVSEPWAKKLTYTYPQKKVYVITNGFDSNNIKQVTQLTHKFSIIYTGQIYSHKQNPTKLVQAIQNLVVAGHLNKKDLEINFYGPTNYSLQWLINENSELSTAIKQCGLIPWESALQKQREAQLLLLLDWEDTLEKGVYPRKIFEYLAAGRPILSVGGSSGDVVENLLAQTKAGVCCRTMTDIETTLKIFYNEYKNAGRVTYNGDLDEINKYNYRVLAEQFDIALSEADK